jgi:outer membrane protein OmpA-like peptidoglycan-associated protein
MAQPGWTAPRGDASQDETYREEKIGLGSGAAIGALAGGPVGLILGAALGGWTGEKFRQERSERRAAERRYKDLSAELDTLETTLSGTEGELAQMRRVMSTRETSFRNTLRDALEVEVFFRTGDAALDDSVQERLVRLGRVLGAMDDFAIVVEGHADARGDSDYNAQLSAARAAAVRDALIESGLSADRITANAVGESESTAAENDLDALALDRRVNLSIVYPDTGNRVARQ